jgi:hypothetical protein
MQILGLADSTPQPESRAKVLFWPAVRNETDVDHVTRQGFWICFVIAFVTLCVGFLLGTAAFFLYAFQAVFFFLSGIGIRMRSVFAASAAFIIYSADFVVAGFSIFRVIGCILLLANLRSTWLSWRWRSTQTEPPPVPLNRTFDDKLSDQLPIAIWPIGRYFYYVMATLNLTLVLFGVAQVFLNLH